MVLTDFEMSTMNAIKQLNQMLKSKDVYFMIDVLLKNR